MHARASAQYSIYIGDKEAIAPILSARDRLCKLTSPCTLIVVQ